MLSLLLSAPLVLSPTPATSQVDAFFDEWQGREGLAVHHRLEGAAPGEGDLDATVKLTWEGARLLLALEVVDDFFAEGGLGKGDRLELIFGRQRMEVALNDLEDRRPVLMRKRRKIKGAQIHATTRRDGWALEMSVPLRALPDLKKAPVPFAVIIHDVDKGAKLPDAVLSTSPLNGDGRPEMTLQLSATAGLFARFQAEQGRADPILFEGHAQIVAGGDPEQVIITTRDVVVLGRGLPEGAPYVFSTPGWAEGEIKLGEVKLKDLDGRRGAEIYVEHEEWAIPKEFRVAQAHILGLRDGFLKTLFSQQLAEIDVKMKASARAQLKHLSKRRIKVKVAQVEGWNPGNYQPIDPPGQALCNPIPLPWSEPKGVTYTLSRDGYWEL